MSTGFEVTTGLIIETILVLIVFMGIPALLYYCKKVTVDQVNASPVLGSHYNS
jgi:hypothetical protein